MDGMQAVGVESRGAGARNMGIDIGAVSKVLRGGGRLDVVLIVGKVGLYG